MRPPKDPIGLSNLYAQITELRRDMRDDLKGVREDVRQLRDVVMRREGRVAIFALLAGSVAGLLVKYLQEWIT